MTMSSKIADQHLARQACIYIRQSTMGQVRFNQESTERQYNLKTKAESLGWKPEQIRILDRDLGQSGSATTNREDFKALVGEVAMGRSNSAAFARYTAAILMTRGRDAENYLISRFRFR